MKVVVGLGNRGEEYEQTRHNVGFEVVDALAVKMINDQFSISKQSSNFNFQFDKKFKTKNLLLNKVLLVKPQAYMNKSGFAVKKIINYYKLETKNLYIVHDDLDIKLGSFKVQFGRGPKVHNGLESIYRHLGSKDFWHVRVGIDNRQTIIEGKSYVLGRFSRGEEKVVGGVVERVVGELKFRLR